MKQSVPMMKEISNSEDRPIMDKGVCAASIKKGQKCDLRASIKHEAARTDGGYFSPQANTHKDQTNEKSGVVD